MIRLFSISILLLFAASTSFGQTVEKVLVLAKKKERPSYQRIKPGAKLSISFKDSSAADLVKQRLVALTDSALIMGETGQLDTVLLSDIKSLQIRSAGNKVRWAGAAWTAYAVGRGAVLLSIPQEDLPEWVPSAARSYFIISSGVNVLLGASIIYLGTRLSKRQYMLGEEWTASILKK